MPVTNRLIIAFMTALKWDQIHAWRPAHRDLFKAVRRTCGGQAQVTPAADLLLHAVVRKLKLPERRADR